jgi:hypothetical protein
LSDMCINTKKSNCLRIGSHAKLPTTDIIVDNKPIVWTNEMRYLGIFILAGPTFKCDTHNAKMKYFRSLNGILGKVGMQSSVQLTLSLVSSFATPVLLYGFDMGCLSRAQVNKLNFPFSAVFGKVFSTFDNNVIKLCQYYCGQMPLAYVLDLQYLNFLDRLRFSTKSPAAHLFNCIGVAEWQYVADKYCILRSDNSSTRKSKIWCVFESDVNRLS